eukprot:scaffold141633_cov31-Tisochrysis_lutea.AAC.8
MGGGCEKKTEPKVSAASMASPGAVSLASSVAVATSLLLSPNRLAVAVGAIPGAPPGAARCPTLSAVLAAGAPRHGVAECPPESLDTARLTQCASMQYTDGAV